MAETTIEWATFTFNGWIGCEKVSAGCKNCYASVDTYARVSASRGLPLWGPGSSRHRTSEANWKKPLTWNRKAKAAREIAENQEGIREHAKQPHQRPRVFCASLADVFEGRADLDPWRADLFTLIEKCDELDWLLLTKRPENIMQMVPPKWVASRHFATPAAAENVYGFWPSHVWIGTSVEDQEQAEKRIPHLLAVPAPVRFLSLEPLLGPVDLRGVEVAQGVFCDPLRVDDTALGLDPMKHVNWLIVGGEGNGSRPCDVAWIRDIVQQGKEAGVATLVKQFGSNPVTNGIAAPGQHWPRGGAELRDNGRGGFNVRLQDAKGGDMSEWPEDLRVRQFPEVRS